MGSGGQQGGGRGDRPGGGAGRERAREHAPEPHAEPLRDSPLHPPLAESGDAWDATTPAGNVSEPPPGQEGGEEGRQPSEEDGA
jgi:hypothetical protein